MKTGKSILNSLNYNENKVKEGAAKCIGAFGYPKDLEDLTFDQKLSRLRNQAALNTRVERPSVHISLNFAPGEQLDRDRLNEIAEDFMQRIGFGKQPFLIYEHTDAGHPHIHIVSIKVDENGDRIEDYNIGRNEIAKARVALEKKYNLVPAEKHKRTKEYLPPAITPEKIQYGKKDLKRLMTHILDYVISRYKFTTLPEYNAILSQYGVVADRGSEDSLSYKNGGLVYRALDHHGNKIGVPIKSSDFYNKPGMKFLNTKFIKNIPLRDVHRKQVANKVKLALLQKPQSLQAFAELLRAKGVYCLARRGKDGNVFGITYVDHTTKTVFNGRALDKSLSTSKVLAACSEGRQAQLPAGINLAQTQAVGTALERLAPSTSGAENQMGSGWYYIEPESPYASQSGLLMEYADILFAVEYTEPLPYALRAPKRAKGRKKKRTV